MRYLLIPLMLILLLGLVSAECIDSDGGKNKYEFGGVTSDGETYQDKCEGENIMEYFCSLDNVASVSLLPCINGCDDGACVVSSSPPIARAPSTNDSSPNLPLYFYGFVVLVIIGLYVYWFKWRKRRH